MNRLSFAILSAALLASATPALTGPSDYGNAVLEHAAAGQITRHGVWDSK